MANRVLSLDAICTAYSMQPPLYPQIKPFLQRLYDTFTTAVGLAA